MQSSAAAFRRKRRQWRGSDFAEGKKVPPQCRCAWEQGSETRSNTQVGARRLAISSSFPGYRILIGFALTWFSLSLWAAVELPQADGSTLTLPRPATSLITLAPHLTELVFAAGAGGQVIATVEYSEYPAAAASIPRIGDAFRLDLERILTLKPDLVIAWQSGNPQPAIARLQSLGIPVWTIEIRQPEQIAATLEWLGQATGNAASARLAARQARHQLETLSSQYAGLAPVSYFYQVAGNPLYTINGQHLISGSLELCGGVNIFQHEGGLAPQVSYEAVIAADPQVVLAPATPMQDDPLAYWRDWPRMRAVGTGALFLLPADEISRASPRMLDAVATACRLLNQVRNLAAYD
jgi:iron complex transport system substrate-binding protein